MSLTQKPFDEGIIQTRDIVTLVQELDEAPQQAVVPPLLGEHVSYEALVEAICEGPETLQLPQHSPLELDVPQDGCPQPNP